MAKNSAAKISANNRYVAKTYKAYNIVLRIKEDADIIESIEDAKAEGLSYREWLRELFEGV